MTGAGQYVDDLDLPGALRVNFVRSDLAHARILGVDASAADQIPGTQVFTAADLDLPTFPLPPFLGIDERMQRPFLATDTVRFVGEIVAAVLTESRELGFDAAELVEIDYDPLPVNTDPQAALADEVVLFADVETNVCVHVPPERPDETLFAGCDVVTAGRVISQRLAACPIEPRSNAAQLGGDGRLTVWLSTQTPHQDRDGLAAILGMAPDQVRVVAPDVGGGFGGKGLDVEDVLVAWLARATGRPVRWTETRSEHMVAMHHGRAQQIDFTLGGDREGRIQALRLAILQDAGAYPGLGAFLPNLTALMASGVYRIPKIEIDIKAVVTNTTQIGPVRGAGRPEATQMLERAIDQFAADVSLDPAEIRRRNFIPADAFPFTTVSGAHYDSGDYGGALELVLEAAGYEQLREAQAQRRRDGDPRLLGIGISAYVEVTNGIAETEFGAVEMTAGR